jgi:hypothetical protein
MPTTLATWLMCAGAAASIAAAPIASAEPVFPRAGTESASATVMDLEAQGFDVVINWLQGHPNVPLSECRVNTINNPNREAPDPATLAIVYVDVVCPNAK